MFDFTDIKNYKENNRFEAKKAAGGLPQSIWQTYSAFANTDGGIILLGAEETDDKTLTVTGLKNPDKLVADFWNTINNPQKVSLNLLDNTKVKIIEIDKKSLITIEVPCAGRIDKPVFIGDNPLKGTFRRDGEGDYHCKEEEINAIYRDKAVKTQDMLVLENMDSGVFNYDTVKSYRSRLKLSRPDHVWENLSDDEFLYKLGAAGLSGSRERCPTAAGLLMFGNDYEIVREYPHYFLDYQEQFDADFRWTDRIYSSTGEWSGNICDFYFKIINRLSQTLKVPFVLSGDMRVEDTPVHKAVREALVNCLVNADYYGRCGLVIKRKADIITFENPGIFRLPVDLAISGGVSDPRNSVIMKMFNLLNIGERAGSGIPSIFSVWNKENLGTPYYSEDADCLRIKLTLPLGYASDKLKTSGKQAIKTSDKLKTSDKQAIKTSDKLKTSDKQAIKTSDKLKLILDFIEKEKNGKRFRASEIADYTGLSSARTRVYLKELVDSGKLSSEGTNKSKVYYSPD